MELLITLDAASDHPQAYKSGHVIVAKPDGWGWSQKERENPYWFIVRTGITQIEADALIASEFEGDKMTARRKNSIDVSGFGPSNGITEVPAAKFRKLVQ